MQFIYIWDTKSIFQNKNDYKPYVKIDLQDVNHKEEMQAWDVITK